ncbi:MAG: electron transfer flavoprotein subunit alpha/FixB family protein [Thermoanaerobaculia bacterium]
MASIWAVLQTRGDDIHPMALETLVAGQALASEAGGSVSAVILGDAVGALAGQLADWDLESVRTLEHEALATYTPGAYVGALANAAAAESPKFVLFPHSYQSVDYVPRLAQRLEVAYVPEAVSFESRDGDLIWKRPVFGGKLQADVRAKGRPVLVSLQSGSFSVSDRRTGACEAAPIAAGDEVRADREILGVEEIAGEHIDLSAAERVVAAGRGVGGEDKMDVVRDLAKALNAEVGASRPVIDGGWLPRDCQIGSSGQTIAPKLYVALGISGAIQHLVGMKGSQTIVAINKDKSAPIFGVADYGIVGDLHEVVPALIQALEEAGD